MDLLFFIVLSALGTGGYGLSGITWDVPPMDPVEPFSPASDNNNDDPDDIYKCVSYTAAHIDISHSINQNFSDFKDCQASGLYTLNRRDRHFKIDIDVQRSWIVEVSAIIFNGTIRPICGLNSDEFAIRPTESCEINGVNVTLTETDRFETLSLYYDVGNLTIITTHNKQGWPPHFNINSWQAQVDIPDSYGLCKGSTCNAVSKGRSSYPPHVIALICDIYIGNYLNSTAWTPSERSLHYNRTIENARQACLFDVESTNLPRAAAGSVEVLFVENQVNGGSSIVTMSDVQANFQTNLESELLKLAETMDRSQKEVEELLARLTTTTTATVSTTVATSTVTMTNTTVLISTPAVTETTAEHTSSSVPTVTMTWTTSSSTPSTEESPITETSTSSTSTTPASTTESSGRRNAPIIIGAAIALIRSTASLFY